MADKIARCPASANTTTSPLAALRASSQPVNSSRCEHHQRAAGIFNGFTPSLSFLPLSFTPLLLSLSRSATSSATPSLSSRYFSSSPFRVLRVYHGLLTRSRHSFFLLLMALSSSSIRHSSIGSIGSSLFRFPSPIAVSFDFSIPPAVPMLPCEPPLDGHSYIRLARTRSWQEKDSRVCHIGIR